MTMALLIRNIRLNKATNRYEATEAGSKYEIDADFINSLLQYLKENPKLLIGHWYRSLSEADQKKVKVSSAYF